MNFTVKQISSLEKIRGIEDVGVAETAKKTLLRGESFSYQIAVFSEEPVELTVKILSELRNYIQVYLVHNVIMDLPTYPSCQDNDFITKEAGVMPDLLTPAERQKNHFKVSGGAAAIWIELQLPADIEPGTYSIAAALETDRETETIKTMEINVIPTDLPEQKLIFTQWIHVDCIADIHHVSIYSDTHWELIDKYMQLAVKMGVNMLLTPIISPPLDTEPGTMRPCIQLVRIEKEQGQYHFDFSLLKRWIALCKKNGIQYLEMSHLFSQWGLKYSPNILVHEQGNAYYKFGWHVPAADESYRDFLNQFMPALLKFLKSEGIERQCYFHISDEPGKEHVEAYQYAYTLVKPLIGDCQTMDAISDINFYASGLISNPVTAVSHIEPFLEKHIENQWLYYCWCLGEKVSNRFLSMPSYRNRILGLQMYKFNIKGFLHWGFNFYYSRGSRYLINPYITSSADKTFPSGDAFSVYPSHDGPLPSVRGLVFQEALQDIKRCHKLETFIGRDAVVEMIDREAGMEITFSEYPRNIQFIPDLMEKMNRIIEPLYNAAEGRYTMNKIRNLCMMFCIITLLPVTVYADAGKAAGNAFQTNELYQETAPLASEDVTITVSANSLDKVTNAGTDGLLTFYFNQRINTDSLTAEHIVIDSEGVPLSYAPHFVSQDQYCIDMHILDSFKSYMVTFSGLMTADGKNVSTKKIAFTTELIAPLAHRENKIIVNAAQGKSAVRESDGKRMEYTNGDFSDNYINDSHFTEKGDRIIFDLEGQYRIEAFGWMYGADMWWHVEGVTFYSMDEYPCEDAGKLLFQLTPEIARTANCGGAEADEKLACRYIAMTSPARGTYGKQYFMWAYADDIFGEWELPALHGAGTYTASIPVRHYTEAKTYSMILSAYDADGRMAAVRFERVSRNAQGKLSAEITVPEETTAVQAALFNNAAKLVPAVKPGVTGQIGSVIHKEAAIADESFAAFAQNDMDAVISVKGGESDVVNVIAVLAESKEQEPEAYFERIGENLTPVTYYTATETVKNGLEFTVSFTEPGLYFIKVTKSDGESAEHIYNRINIVSQEDKDAFAKAVFETDGTDLNELLSYYIDELEIVGQNSFYDLETMCEDGFGNVVVMTREALYPNAAVTMNQSIALLNTAAVIHILMENEPEKAQPFFEKDAALNGLIAEYKSFAIFSGIFNDLKAHILDSDSLKKVMTQSALLSFVCGGTAKETAAIMEKHTEQLGCDLRLCKENNIELERVASRLIGKDAKTLFGEGFKKEYESAVQAEIQANEQINTSPKPAGGGGGGGGAGISIPAGVVKEPEAEQFPEDIKPEEPTEAVRFLDMAEYNWAEEAVDTLVSLGALTGYDGGLFCPDKQITRAEFITILIKAFDVTVDEEKIMKVLDCPSDAWYYPYVSIAYSVGIVSGKDEFTFGAFDCITREEMAVMISNVFSYKNILFQGDRGMTAKEQVSEFAQNAFAAAVGTGILSGYGDGTFRPQGTTTRAESAVMVYRALCYMQEVQK